MRRCVWNEWDGLTSFVPSSDRRRQRGQQKRLTTV